MTLSHDQIATAVRYYRSDETRDLASVAEAIGVPRSELVAACRAYPKLADALAFSEENEPASAAEASSRETPGDVRLTRKPDQPA